MTEISFKNNYFCADLYLKKEKVGKFSDIFYSKHGGFFFFFSFSTGIFLLIMILKPGTNIIRWIRSGIEIKNQEEQIRQYNEDIEKMEERIKMLTSDKDTLEKFAREQFYFCEPGDEVFVIENN